MYLDDRMQRIFIIKEIEVSKQILSALKFFPCLIVAILFTALTTESTVAQWIPRNRTGGLHELATSSDQLNPQARSEPIDSQKSLVAQERQQQWAHFALAAGGDWMGYLDQRTGFIDYVEGAGIPWLPGRGNRLKAEDVAQLGGRATATLNDLEAIARDFLPQVAEMLGIDPQDLTLNKGRSEHPADYLWYVDFDVRRGDLPIEGARVVFRINNGNLIQLGTENIPSPDVATPEIVVDREQAREVLADYVGGLLANDQIIDAGSLHLLPAAIENAGSAEGFAFGQGRGLLAVWDFTFRRFGETGTWRGRVDATTGALVAFGDLNHYAQVSGGVYQGSPATGAEAVLPMPYANLSTGGYASSAGVYSYTSGTVSSSLNGRYVRILDTCGSISQGSNATGNIPFGTSAGTDCSTPGHGGGGNTHSARTQFYHLNRAKEVARGWLPANSWVNSQLSANVNLYQTCNAYWYPPAVNFFRSGGGCNNTGEIVGITLHEFGHGLDANDGNGFSPDNGTGEAYGDFTAALATHVSCMGPGFLSSKCGGYGDACTSCTGVRDIDYAKHASNTPHTVANFIQPKCPTSADYKGPCGREGHCESYIASEALWDLVNRDLGSPGSGSAWATAERLWYLSRPTASAAFTCTTTGTWKSNGCSAGSLWRTLRAADDDDGNLSNGTPHSNSLYRAFNRHGIACTSDPGASISFRGCSQPAASSLSAVAGSNSVSLSWTNRGSGIVYDLYRSEISCARGQVKIANNLTTTSRVDNQVANGTKYYYRVVNHPTGNEACGYVPNSCTSVTPVCTPPARPTGLTATAASSSKINLSWTAASGAASYRVYRATVSGGPYTKVGTTTSTSFANTGLTANTKYYYVVRAFKDCESASSTQVSATTLNTSTCATRTLYSNGFESGSGLGAWTRGTYNGAATTNWRGIQACTAQSGSRIFRYGGSTCSTDYSSSEFLYARPPAIFVPSGSRTTRLTFGHRWQFETGFDGGTLALSFNGVDYFYVPGSTIISGIGYNGTVSSLCPPSGAAGAGIFTGERSTFASTTVNLDAACNAITGGTAGCAGRSLYIAFTSITDCSLTFDGWFLDNVTVTACTP